MANDSDPDGDTLSITGVGSAAHGSTANTDSNVTYTPNVGYTGADSFSYSITDNRGGTASAIVSVMVNPTSVSKMHVSNITITTRTKKTGRTTTTSATAKVTVLDTAGLPVSGVIVSGQWSGLATDVDSGVTNSSGVVNLTSNSTSATKGIFNFTISSLVKTGWVFDDTIGVLSASKTLP